MPLYCVIAVTAAVADAEGNLGFQAGSTTMTRSTFVINGFTIVNNLGRTILVLQHYVPTSWTQSNSNQLCDNVHACLHRNPRYLLQIVNVDGRICWEGNLIPQWRPQQATTLVCSRRAHPPILRKPPDNWGKTWMPPPSITILVHLPSGLHEATRQGHLFDSNHWYITPFTLPSTLIYSSLYSLFLF
ncbi:hypothetical protein LXL04_002097 [Taraxacum kok-saghyz]